MKAAIRFLSRPRIILLLSLVFLTGITLYCAWYANYYLSGNADDIVYPYLFKHFQFHDIILPSQHSNILKFPLFILQSILPYTFPTLSVVNIGLVLGTVLIWALLLVWIFGKRYATLICLAFGAILLGSQLLNLDLLGTTIRNIEYPIALAFIIYVGLLMKRQVLTAKKAVAGICIGLLYALTLAGDSFFLYTSLVPILLTIGFLWFVADTTAKRQFQFAVTSLYAFGVGISAFIIREAVTVLGIAHYYTAGVFLPHVLPTNHIAPSITTAATQALGLFGANIFGQKVAPSTLLIFANFFLMTLGLVGIGYILVDVYGPRHSAVLKRLGLARAFVLGVLAVSFCLTFLLYIGSDLVVSETASGNIVSSFQERYISLLPLVLIAGIAYFIQRNFSARRIVCYGVPIVIAASLLIGAPATLAAHTYNGQLRDSQIAVARSLESNHVSFALTGYWYGSTVRFWSHDRVAFASIAACNLPQPPFNNRLSWYRPSNTPNEQSALVVVRSGIDAIYWTCSDDQLRSIYGSPTKIITLDTPDRPQLWLYNYDLRTKLLPMPY